MGMARFRPSILAQIYIVVAAVKITIKKNLGSSQYLFD